jgi:hypothetical protein
MIKNGDIQPILNTVEGSRTAGVIRMYRRRAAARYATPLAGARAVCTEGNNRVNQRV